LIIIKEWFWWYENGERNRKIKNWDIDFEWSSEGTLKKRRINENGNKKIKKFWNWVR
jgi:hypothetical protein